MLSLLALPVLVHVGTAAAWPHDDVMLQPPVVAAAATPKRPWLVYLDAGHGAPGNSGNQSVLCEAEETHTLAVAERVADRLRRTGRFIVIVSRTGAQRPRYPRRLRNAAKHHADVFVSLHSDARGEATLWQPTPGVFCLRNDAVPGMGLLVSDEGPALLVERRLKLARTLSSTMAATGFHLYDGTEWLSQYEADSTPGVFIDRRPKNQRVFLLRAPRMPSVIIETHHALDFLENARWKDPATADAFGDALAAGLQAFLNP